MKIKLLIFVTGLILTTTLFTSCFDSKTLDNNEPQGSDASINLFSMEDIHTTYKVQIDGKEVELIDTVVGKEYPFVINQRKRTIHNIDSLPIGTNVSRVKVKVIADTPYIYYSKNDIDTLWTEVDSLDFTKPITFRVMANDMTYGDKYKVQINVHKQIPEQMTWNQLTTSFASDTLKGQKAIVFNKNVYVFADNDKQVKVTSTPIEDGKTWTPLDTLSIPEKADYSSVMAWGNNVYVLAQGSLYVSADVKTWEKIETAPVLKTLVACVYNDNYKKLIGINDQNVFVESEEGDVWEEKETVDEQFPTQRISFAAYVLNTNEELSRIVLTGNNTSKTDTISTVWSKLSTDESWAPYFNADGNLYPCPKFENISMIHYNNKLYTFGGETIKEEAIVPAFSIFYESTNNGLDWTPVKRFLKFPDSFTKNYKQSNGNYSCIIDENNFLWIIWSHGGVWKGRINKLGFDTNK